MAGLFDAMRGWHIVAILLIAASLVLAGCGGDFPPYAPQTVTSAAPAPTCTLYICGAVRHEGYISVQIGCSYEEAVRLAGLLPQSMPPQGYNGTVDGSVRQITVNYSLDGRLCYCVNANSPRLLSDAPIEGLLPQEQALVAQYLRQHGAIHNKVQLADALGELYDSCFYKFFVAEAD